MRLFHFHHQNKFQKLVHSEFWLFEFSVWLHTFSRSMIAIFIPIFLLQTGYEIGEVMFFYFLFNILDVPLNFVSKWFIQKIGARLVIIIGSLFSILFFLGLFQLEANNWSFLLCIAFFLAVYDTFYWVAHLYLFISANGKHHNVSRDTSILEIVRRIAGVLAPALGAVILLFFNQKVLIAVSIIILLFSIWPLFYIKHIPDKPKKKQKSIKKFFNNWQIVQDYLVSGFYSVHYSAEYIIWPLFIFLFFSNIESVAILPIIVSITAIIFTYLAGGINKEKRNLMIALGSLLIAIVWILRLFIGGGIFYYASVFFVGLFSILVSIPLDSNIFEKGARKDPLMAATWRNTANMSFRVILYGVLSIMVNIFNVSFILAAISLFIVIVISYFTGGVFIRRKNSTLYH